MANLLDEWEKDWQKNTQSLGGGNMLDQWESDAIQSGAISAPKPPADEGILSNIWKGGKAGVAGSVGGLAGWFGGKNAVTDYTDEVLQENQRSREHDGYDADYFLNGSGFAYDVGNLLGSFASMAPAALLVPGGAPATIASAGARLLGGLGARELARRAAVQAAQKGGGALGNYIRYGLGAGTAESLVEGGSGVNRAVQEGQTGLSPYLTGAEITAKNWPLLVGSQALEGGILHKGFSRLGGKAGESLAKRARMAPLRTAPYMAGEGLTESAQEVMQERAQEEAFNEPTGGFLPSDMTENERKALYATFAPAALLGGIGGFRGSMRAKGNEPESKPAPYVANWDNGMNGLDTDLFDKWESAPGMTDLTGVRRDVVAALNGLANEYGGKITITGAAEKGVHAEGADGHEGGWKVDIGKNLAAPEKFLELAAKYGFAVGDEGDHYDLSANRAGGVGGKQVATPDAFVSDGQQPSGQREGHENAWAIYDVFKAAGYSDNAIAGILGRVQQEHNFDTSDVPEHEEEGMHLGGYGMFQWNGSRTTDFLNWAQENGLDPQDATTQARYALLEAQQRGLTPERMNQLSHEEAADLWTSDWEVGRPGDERKYAGEWLTRLQNGGGVAGGTTASTRTPQAQQEPQIDTYDDVYEQFAKEMSQSSDEETKDFFSGMFTKNDKFVDSEENRRKIDERYGEELKEFADVYRNPSVQTQIDRLIDKAVKAKDYNRVGKLQAARMSGDIQLMQKYLDEARAKEAPQMQGQPVPQAKPAFPIVQTGGNVNGNTQSTQSTQTQPPQGGNAVNQNQNAESGQNEAEEVSRRLQVALNNANLNNWNLSDEDKFELQELQRRLMALTGQKPAEIYTGEQKPSNLILPEQKKEPEPKKPGIMQTAEDKVEANADRILRDRIRRALNDKDYDLASQLAHQSGSEELVTLVDSIVRRPAPHQNYNTEDRQEAQPQYTKSEQAEEWQEVSQPVQQEAPQPTANGFVNNTVTTKKGKQFPGVTWDGRVEKDEWARRRKFAKENNGWWDGKSKSFGFRTEQDRENFLQAVNAPDEESSSTTSTPVQAVPKRESKALSQYKKNVAKVVSDYRKDKITYEDAFHKVVSMQESAERVAPDQVTKDEIQDVARGALMELESIYNEKNGHEFAEAPSQTAQESAGEQETAAQVEEPTQGEKPAQSEAEPASNGGGGQSAQKQEKPFGKMTPSEQLIRLVEIDERAYKNGEYGLVTLEQNLRKDEADAKKLDKDEAQKVLDAIKTVRDRHIGSSQKALDREVEKANKEEAKYDNDRRGKWKVISEAGNLKVVQPWRYNTKTKRYESYLPYNGEETYTTEDEAWNLAKKLNQQEEKSAQNATVEENSTVGENGNPKQTEQEKSAEQTEGKTDTKLKRIRHAKEEMQAVAKKYADGEISQAEAYKQIATIAKGKATKAKDGLPNVTFIDNKIKQELNDYGDRLIDATKQEGKPSSKSDFLHDHIIVGRVTKDGIVTSSPERVFRNLSDEEAPSSKQEEATSRLEQVVKKAMEVVESGGRSLDNKGTREQYNAVVELLKLAGIAVDNVKFVGRAGNASIGGSIMLDDSKTLSIHAPVHEYTHIWDYFVMINNPRLWAKGVALMKESPLWQVVKKEYPNHNDDRIATECHAYLTGAYGEDILNEMAKSEKTLADKLKGWLKEFWRSVKNALAPWTDDEISSMSLEDFLNMPLSDLAEGTKIGEALRYHAYPVKTISVQGLENTVNVQVDDALEREEAYLEYLNQQKKDALDTQGQENPYAEKVKSLEEKLADLNRQIKERAVEESKKQNDTETDEAQEEKPSSNKEYSVTEGKVESRSIEDIKAGAREAYPNAKIQEDGNTLHLTMPNGQKIHISIVNEINASEDELSRAKEVHGIDQGAQVSVEGYAEVVGGEGFSAVAQGSRDVTDFHEAYHMAELMAFTKKELRDAERLISPSSEERADEYARWKKSRQKHSNFAKLWQKIADVAAKMAGILGYETKRNIFRKVESGEIYQRDNTARNTSRQYSVNASDNSTSSYKQRVKNFFSKSRVADTPEYRRMIKGMMEEIAGIKIRYGKIDPKMTAVYDSFKKVIRAKSANDWERVLPLFAGATLEKLGVKPNEKLNAYISDWIQTGAPNNTSREAEIFQKAMRDNPEVADQLIDLQEAFQRWDKMNAMERGQNIISWQNEEKTSFSDQLGKAYDQFIEELGPIMRLVQKAEKEHGKLRTAINPYEAFRLFRGYKGRAMTMIEGSSKAIDDVMAHWYPNLKWKGFKSIHAILDSIDALHNEKVRKEFETYCLACHVYDIHKANDLTTMEIDHQKKLLEKADGEKKEEIQAKIDRLEKSLMETPLSRTDCGNIIREHGEKYGQAQQDLVNYSNMTLAILKDSGVISEYRYSRILKKWPNYVPMFRVFDDNDKVQFGDSMKAMMGSKRDVIEPLQSIIRNTFEMMRKAEKNKAKCLLAQLARMTDVGNYIEEVNNSKPDDKTTIVFYEDGQKRYLQTDPAVVTAVNGMGLENSNMYRSLLRIPAAFARSAFTVWDPTFIVRNTARDVQDAFVYNKKGTWNPLTMLKDWLQAFLHVWRQDDIYWEWMSSGAAQASAVSVDRNYTQSTLDKMTKTRAQRWKNPKFLFLDTMQKLAEWSETSTRVANYERVKKNLSKGGVEHLTNLELAEAAYESRDLMDFARGGKASRVWNSVSVFANPALQGWDKFYRTFKGLASKDKQERKEAMYAAARLVLAGMLPALVLTLMNWDKDWWKEIPDWQKDTHWIISPKVRIPKGQDIGVRFFSSLIEKGLDSMYNKNPMTAKRVLKPVWEQIPDIMPTAMMPIIEAAANYSFFKDAPIVPKYQENLPAKLQYSPFSSGFAKFISEQLSDKFDVSLSPRQIDHVLTGLGGNVSRTATGAVDVARGSKQLNTSMEEMPILRGFMMVPYKNSATVEKFYKEYKKQQEGDKAFKATHERMEGYSPAKYKRMSQANKKMSELNKKERKLLDDNRISPERKQELQAGIQRQRIAIAKRAMGK